MEFIAPMLAHDATERGVKLGNKGYAAEPKLDGKRGQLFIEKGKAVAMFSRAGSIDVSCIRENGADIELRMHR
jgi:ATP-dependent DNA ligase